MNPAAAAASPDTQSMQGMSLHRRMRDSAGTSLIEVLVAIVIFLVGIVSVLRMFPGGFVSLRHGENFTMANRLAQTELERLQGRAANIPSGIMPWGWDGTTLNIMSRICPDDMGEQEHPGIAWPPPFIKPYYLSDVNKFRRILGENTRIPAPVQTAWGLVSVYVLAWSPVMYDPRPDPECQLINKANEMEIYGGAMRRRWLPRTYNDSAILTRLRTAADYAIDYDDAKLYLKVFGGSEPRTYLLTCSYWQGISATEMSLKPASISITVGPATLDEKSQGYFERELTELSGVTGFEGIDNGSDSLARQFRQISEPSLFSDDPYEFGIVDQVAGTLAFNPVGYGYEEDTALGKRPLTANIDYTVLDWHIIREERRISDVINSPTDLDAKLTLRHIRESGQSLEGDGSDYKGLAWDYGLPFDVMAVDLDTGDCYTEDSNIPGTDPPRRAMEVDYKEGTIRFDPDFWKVKRASLPVLVESPFQGKTFRIYYRAEGDWAVQVCKSFDVFRRSYGLPIEYYQYYLAGGNVYFQPSNAGTSVALDYTYQRPGQPEVFISGQVYEIPKENYDSGQVVYYIALLDKVKTLYGGDAKVTRISRVYGVSLAARVVWRESGRGLLVGGWRKVELQTYMTRSAD